MKAARVAAHVHSSWSYDAQWSLPDIARAFRRHRYDAVLMAEHDRSFDEHKWADYRLASWQASR
jgi:histidinol phosphatase-like PHP family hydrolase